MNFLEQVGRPSLRLVGELKSNEEGAGCTAYVGGLFETTPLLKCPLESNAHSALRSIGAHHFTIPPKAC